VNNYAVVAAYNNAKKGAYKNGRYIPAKLAGEEDLQMLTLGEGQGSGKWPPPIDMNNERDFLICLYDAGNATSLSGEWTFAYHVESETESQWRQTANPIINPVVMLDVQWVVGNASQDYENASHLKSIWNFIRANAGRLISVGESLTPFLPAQARVPAAVGLGILNGLNDKFNV
jgi:hypothetical protein